MSDPGVPAALPRTVQQLVDRGVAAGQEGAFALARDHYQQALGALESADHAETAAAIIRWTGDTHRDEGDLEAARDAYVAARAIAEVNDDRAGLAYVLNSLGILEWEWGRLEGAAQLYEEAGEIAREIEDDRLSGMVAQNIGVLLNVRGDLEGALEKYEEAVALYRGIDDRKRLAGLMSNIGMLHTDLERWEEAERMFELSAELCRAEADHRSQLMVDVNRTELYILTKEFTRATQVCDAAFVLARRLDHQSGLAETHKNYGIIFRHGGNIGLAETHLKRAREIGERFGTPLLLGEIQREMGEVYRLQERNTDALQALNLAHQYFSALSAQADVADIARRLGELEKIFLEIVSRWGESIESKDRYTAGHCHRVADYSCRLAREMGFDPQNLTWFRMGALLHDLGKTMIPEGILNKRGRLTPAEWEIMQQHPAAGEDLLSSVEFPWDIRPMLRSHHERWDGTGYPDGLAGHDIPIAARILTVADVFDALTTHRSYREAYSVEKALAIMAADSGSIFDPEPLEAFTNLIRSELILPVGVGG